LIKFEFPGFINQAGFRRRPCQWLCAGLLALAAGGCESGKQQVSGEIGSAEGFAGAVVADEPRAVLAARDALAAGGSAADATVALYFTLAVTLPSSAGVGGGGVCLIHAPDSERPYVLDFLPRASADGSIGLPGNVRGMAMLHAEYGRIRWTQLLAPAEDLARGTSVSRALARELADNGYALFADPEANRVFSRADGGLVGEGDGLQQFDLVGTLSQIRRGGAGAFYSGSLATRLTQAAQDAGVPLSAETLRTVRPEARDALTVGVGARAAYFAAPPAHGGLLGAQLAVMLQGRGDAGTGTADHAHLLVEASKRAQVETARRTDDGEAIGRLSPSRLQSLMQDYDPALATPISAIGSAPGDDGDPGATGFVVADGDGLAIACEVTLNRPFGTGRIIPGTGVFLAAPPSGSGGLPLGPVIAINPERGTADFIGAASSGLPGTTALATVLVDTVARGEPLDSTIDAKRVYYSAASDTVSYEDGTSESVVSALSQRGHSPQPAGALGRVNAIWCSGGLPDDSDSCRARNDPRGSGLAVIQAE
jgi:gamma-glutamyltranspeptidase/glutathione hydrolase